MMKPHGRTLCAILYLVMIPVASADYQSDLEEWFNSDDDKEFEAILSINEGQLNFLSKPPEQPVHHHQNKLVISHTSLNDGWVSLHQCHYNMDNFPRVEVLYSPKRIRKLEIISSKNIELAWVENSSIQLLNVTKGATLCIQAESRALSQNIDGSYTLKNGPFMRKFLDGYFPMHVSIDIKLPDQLEFASISPAQQNGFVVSENLNAIHLDAWFEGRLKTILKLKQREIN